MKWIFWATCWAMGQSAVAASKLECTPREMSAKDCQLQSGTYTLRLLRETVAWNDGTWHVVDDMPLKEEGVQWRRVHFDKLRDWPILQLWLWDTGVGEAKVESLHWYVISAENQVFRILNQAVLSRRRVEVPEPEVKDEGNMSKSKKAAKLRTPRYIGDPVQNHSVALRANGDLEVKVGDHSQIFERKKAHGI